MSAQHSPVSESPRVAAIVSFAMLCIALAGCAQVGESMSSAFADPAKYDLYDCKQLEAERRMLGKRVAELQGLIAKAQTGAAGTVVAEVAYRNDYVALRAQQKLAEEAWRRGKCHETLPAETLVEEPKSAAPAPSGAKGNQPLVR